ncbi:hypothetical protein [Brevundimonas sp. FT23042]|uniref:hypothetical protein n=1 Tax=Brevundimonas sp. FT23042 TaxID=3393749 RepID=UPI003B58AFFF
MFWLVRSRWNVNPSSAIFARDEGEYSMLMAVFALALEVLSGFAGQDASAPPEPLQCNAGPLGRSFGGSDWLVYGCSDRATVVVVSAPGSPAMPFVFTLSSRDAGVQVSGEGSGDASATARAFEDLKKISRQDLDALIREAEAHP